MVQTLAVCIVSVIAPLPISVILVAIIAIFPGIAGIAISPLTAAPTSDQCTASSVGMVTGPPGGMSATTTGSRSTAPPSSRRNAPPWDLPIGLSRLRYGVSARRKC